jgi:hypothetical protein
MSDERVDETIDRVHLGDHRDPESVAPGDVGGDGTDTGHDRWHCLNTECSNPLIDGGTRGEGDRIG